MGHGKEQPQASCETRTAWWIGKDLPTEGLSYFRKKKSILFPLLYPASLRGCLFWWHLPLNLLSDSSLKSRILASMFWATPIVLGEKLCTLANDLLPQHLTLPFPHGSIIPLSFWYHHPLGWGSQTERTRAAGTQEAHITLKLKVISLLLEPLHLLWYSVPAPISSLSDSVIVLGKPMQAGMGILQPGPLVSVFHAGNSSRL